MGLAAGGGVLERIAARLDAAVVRAAAIEGGYGGAALYRVRLGLGGSVERDVAVKVGRVQGTPIVPDDAFHDRIYSARSWSLAPVHALLRGRGLPTYELLGHGFPDDEVPFFWVAMSLLPGAAARGRAGEPDPEGFHRACGEALGRLHAVERPFDGAVDRAAPHGLSWSDAFFGSLEETLAGALAGRDGALRAHEGEVRAFVAAHRRAWEPPRSYVLSHVDGLQGQTRRYGRRWRFTGHVDLEDYVFTDARFPLAGYELGAAGPVPSAFWDGYRSQAEVDTSYERVRDLFKLYYLLDWFWIVYEPRWNPTPADVARSAARQTAAVLRLVRG